MKRSLNTIPLSKRKHFMSNFFLPRTNNKKPVVSKTPFVGYEMVYCTNKINQKIDGFLHSLAFANFSEGPKPFLETRRDDFLEATQISSFSLVEMSHALKELFSENASIVTISISNTKATSYGYLGPVKSMLETTVPYLAKSFSEFSNVRVNAVGAGPLKTSASAGIPDYIDNYLYAEELTLRKEALQTQEVADTVCFLLSPKSSGINASTILVDAGMSCNYFDQNIVKAFAKK